MKRPAPVESASAFIDEKIMEPGDWRGKTLAKVRKIIHAAAPEIGKSSVRIPLSVSGQTAETWLATSDSFRVHPVEWTRICDFQDHRYLSLPSRSV